MRDYYEDLWQRLGEDAAGADFPRRLRFLLSEVKPGDRVLDLGSGAGAFTGALAAAGARPIGVEIASAAIERARDANPSAEFRLAPVEGPLPLSDNAFDVVWASEVIEHVADTARWLSEVRRVLVPGGRLLLTTPSHGRLRIALLGVERLAPPLGDHLHLYTRRSLREILREFGFGAVTVRTVAGPPLLRRLLFARAAR